MWYLRLSRIILVIFVVSSISANEAVVDYRHESMEAIELHFDAIKKFVTDELSFEGHLVKHTSALLDYAEMLPDLFVEGSEGGETLNRVWQEPEKFQEALDEFKKAAEILNESAEKTGDEFNKDEVMDGFKSVADTCKGCHRRYRE